MRDRSAHSVLPVVEVEAADYAFGSNPPYGLRSLPGSIALQEDFNGARAVVSYLYDKEKSHEISHDRTGNSLHSHKHVSACAIPWTGWLRNGHSSVSWLVHRAGGYNECTADLEQHRSRSGRADHPHASAIAECAAAHDTVVWRYQVNATGS
jgi:hypothetical protein